MYLFSAGIFLIAPDRQDHFKWDRERESERERWKVCATPLMWSKWSGRSNPQTDESLMVETTTHRHGKKSECRKKAVALRGRRAPGEWSSLENGAIWKWVLITLPATVLHLYRMSYGRLFLQQKKKLQIETICASVHLRTATDGEGRKGAPSAFFSAKWRLSCGLNPLQTRHVEMSRQNKCPYVCMAERCARPYQAVCERAGREWKGARGVKAIS